MKSDNIRTIVVILIIIALLIIVAYLLSRNDNKKTITNENDNKDDSDIPRNITDSNKLQMLMSNYPMLTYHSISNGINGVNDVNPISNQRVRTKYISNLASSLAINNDNVDRIRVLMDRHFQLIDRIIDRIKNGESTDSSGINKHKMSLASTNEALSKLIITSNDLVTIDRMILYFNVRSTLEVSLARNLSHKSNDDSILKIMDNIKAVNDVITDIITNSRKDKLMIST